MAFFIWKIQGAQFTIQGVMDEPPEWFQMETVMLMNNDGENDNGNDYGDDDGDESFRNALTIAMVMIANMRREVHGKSYAHEHARHRHGIQISSPVTHGAKDP